jgi:hypothetical protein
MELRKNRFDIAKDKARELLREVLPDSKTDIYVTAPNLARIEAALGPGAALSVIRTLKPFDVGESEVEYGEAFSRLAKDGGYDRIVFLTDHPVRGGGGTVEAVSVGRPQGNLAITSFHVSRPSFVANELEARIEITSFSMREETVKLLLKGGGETLSTQIHTIAPRKSVVATFKAVPFHTHYESEIEAGDALVLDNRSFAVPPASEGLSILGISPRPEALQSLRSISGLSLKMVNPDGYEGAVGGEHSLEIFHFSAPTVLPERHALFVLPPKENPLVSVGDPLAKPVVSGWRDPHPLTRYVNFPLFRLSFASPLKPISLGDEIVQSPEGALVLAVERQGFRYLVLGFDPFPYLGRDNLPVSIFTLNLLGWFFEGLSGSSTVTGEPIKFRADPKTATLMTPDGEEIPIEVDSQPFSRTFVQGIYHLVRGGDKEDLVVNFQDLKESDLDNPVPIVLEEETGVKAGRSYSFPLWPYLVLLSLLFLLLEWLFSVPISQAPYLPDRGAPQHEL